MTRRRRWSSAIVFAAAGLLLVSGLVVVAIQSPSASVLLAEAVDYVADQPGVAFEGRLMTEMYAEERSADDPGTSFLQTVDIEGVARFPDTTRLTVDDGEALTEVVSLGADLFVRSARNQRQLAKEKWVDLSETADDARNGVARPGEGPAGPQNLAEIRDLRRILASGRDAAIVERRAGTTEIRATIDPETAFADLGQDVDRGTLRLTLTRAGRVETIRIELHITDGVLIAEYDLDDWGEPPAIAAPAPDDIDETPGIEEDAVLAFDDAPLLQPRALPTGWTLQAASVIPAEATAEDCDQIELDYAPAAPSDEASAAAYLSLFEIPTSCPGLGIREPDDRSFKAGKVAGFVRDLPEGGIFAQFTVGRTVIQADTVLAEEDLARILADLVPLDFERPYDELPGIGGPVSEA